MNWQNAIFLFLRAILASGGMYAASKGNSELAGILGGVAAAITTSGSYITPPK